MTVRHLRQLVHRLVMIDSHIHLDAAQYYNANPVIKRAHEAGVKGIVAPGTGPASNLRVLALARQFPGFVYPAIGFHPEAYELTDDDLETTLEQVRTYRDEICAIGETGLPYYGDLAKSEAIQRRAAETLGRLAETAARLDLALILHAPHEKAADALAIIRRAKVARAVFHWHKSDAATTMAIVAAGYMISLTPEVVYRDRDREIAKIVPLGNLMVETDGPCSHGGPYAGIATEPWMVADAIAAIAEIKGAAGDDVLAATTRNTKWLFRLSH